MYATISQGALANAAPVDELVVTTIVESVAVYADSGNFEALEKLYADEVLVDYSSLSGGQPALRSPQALMTEWASSLPGFDQTRHELSDVSVNISGETATASADVIAEHWIDGNIWEVEGTYTYALAREGDKWKIEKMTFTLEDESGSRGLIDKAVKAAKAEPTSYVQRQLTRGAVIDFLEGLEQIDMDRVNSVWSDDAVQDMPYNTEGTPSRVSGRDNLIALYSGWPENAANPSFTDGLIFYDMQDPQMVFVEYKGRVDIVPTGREYRQTYGGLFHVNREGQITLFREYYDPRAFQYAFAIGE